MSEEIRSCQDVDDQLAAYIDGEQTDAVQKSVDEHLRGCPSCRAHADRERAARDLLRTHRDRLRTAAPVGLQTRCEEASRILVARKRSPMRAWVPLSLAATLILAVGAVFVFGVNDRVEALAAGMVLDHTKCFKITPAAGKNDAASDEALWQEKQGWTIKVPPSSDEQELTLVDVRRCLTAGGWSAHLMYQWHGHPLSVYVLPKTVGTEGPAETLGVETTIWAAGGRTYAVLADGRPPGFDGIVSYMKVHAQ